MNCRNGTDKFELLDTTFVSSLESHLFTFITVSNSFPVFLSAVTQNLFEKQTIYAAPTWIVCSSQKYSKFNLSSLLYYSASSTCIHNKEDQSSTERAKGEPIPKLHLPQSRNP